MKKKKFKLVIEYDFEKKELKADLGKDEWLIPQILGIMNDVEQYLIGKWFEGENMVKKKSDKLPIEQRFTEKKEFVEGGE